MRFTLKFSGSIYGLLRHCGYHPQETGKEKNGESSFARRLNSSDYPRFHAYVSPEKKIPRDGKTVPQSGTQETEGVLSGGRGIFVSRETFIINLHLDQKKPSYEGTPDHGGEYEGELVEQEAERIKKMSLMAHL